MLWSSARIHPVVCGEMIRCDVMWERGKERKGKNERKERNEGLKRGGKEGRRRGGTVNKK